MTKKPHWLSEEEIKNLGKEKPVPVKLYKDGWYYFSPDGLSCYGPFQQFDDARSSCSKCWAGLLDLGR
jgi:hypothetical protein